MTLIALALSLSIAAIGAFGIAFPLKLLTFARLFDSLGGLWIAATLRVVFGMALYQSAPTSHAPQILSVLGIVIIVVGLLTPLIGVERLRRILDWWAAQATVFTQVLAGCVLVFGLLLASAVVT